MSTVEETDDTNAVEKKPVRFQHPSSMNSEYNNPCTKEQTLSFKCLSDNDYDHDSCTMQFINYQNCKDFWARVRLERKRKKITPYLPLPEEREKIKEEFLKEKSAQ